MTDSGTEQTAEMRRKYLRWSIPSIVLAIVSAGFALASLQAQRHIRGRYDAVIREYLDSASDRANTWTVESMRRAEVAAKRLLVENPDSADAAETMARVDLVSQNHALLQIASSATDSESRSSRDWLELAMNSRQHAVDSMRRAAKLDGPAAVDARLWILDWRFRVGDARVVESEARLLDLQSECEALLASGADARLLLADLLIHRALRFPSEENLQRVSQWIADASEQLLQIPQSSIQRNASLVEATTVSDPAQARKEAVRSISEYLQSKQSSAASWRDREAMFRMRIAVGNLREAFDFAWTSLGEVSVLDRESFRFAVAASALRSMVLHSSFPKLDPPSEKHVALLFGFALRFAPDSGQVVRVVEALLGVDASTLALQRALEGGHDAAARDALQWVRMLGESPSTSRSTSLPPSVRDDPLLAPGTVLALRLTRKRGKLDDRALLEILNSAATAWKSNVELHMLRSELAMKLEDYKTAIDSLSKLNQQFPDEPQIARALSDAKSRMRSGPFESAPKDTETP
ncbi:MAG: hypothetical protein ACK553_00225 [Planctomycetota bacterium]|jgi:tetratricopeptide (TPR) repeat protein